VSRLVFQDVVPCTLAQVPIYQTMWQHFPADCSVKTSTCIQLLDNETSTIMHNSWNM